MKMKVLVNLRHVEQRHSWDCGVSSVAMVLSSSNRMYLNDNLKGVSKEEGFLNSTWTIDLCYLLSRFKVPHQFCTKTLGVHPQYSKQTFYKNALLKDETRVRERFASAEASGIDVREKSVNLQDILKHLERNLPVIALVNSWQLNCKNCFSSTVPVLVKSVLSKTCSYQGHYVVLCGYDSSSREIFYRNPSRKNKVCVARFESFEESRKCFGTDEDLIFILDCSYQQ